MLAALYADPALCGICEPLLSRSRPLARIFRRPADGWVAGGGVVLVADRGMGV